MARTDITRLALLLMSVAWPTAALGADREFLSAPFPDDADVDIVQGWFYTWDTVTSSECDSTHEGIDYATLNSSGTSATWDSFPVLAAAPGWAWDGYSSSYGNYVLVRHIVRDGTTLDDYYTLYAHLDSVAAKVSDAPSTTGVRVQRGEYLGEAGETGSASGGVIHLHFELLEEASWSCTYRLDPYDLYDQVDSNAEPGVYASQMDLSSGMGSNPYFISDPPRVSSNEDYVDLAAVEIDDDSTLDSTGDGDGVLERSETVELQSWIRSSGPYTYSTPHGRLYDRGTDECALVDLSESFPSLGLREAVNESGDYEVTVSSSASAGSYYEFYLLMKEGSSSGSTINRATYALTIGSREFSGISSPFYTIDDDTSTSSGDNDGHVEPGETIEMVVYLQNFDGSTRSVTGTLSESSSYVTVTDSTETWSSLAPGDIDPSPGDFDFTVSSSMDDNSVIEFTLRLTDTTTGTLIDTAYLSVNVGM